MEASLPRFDRPVWVITGPTAAGKSALGLEIADREGLEIVSMDSMAVYRRMDLGTAKPSADELARVQHHAIDVVDPSETFDTGRFCALAEGLLRDAHAQGRGLLFVGGTPLYLMALFKGMIEGVPADPELRRRLSERDAADPGCLHRELTARDPAAAAKIHANDLKRQIRALEVLEITGRPISEQHDRFDAPGWRIPCRILLVDQDRDALRERIKLRTRAMVDSGLVEETRAIRDDCGFSSTAAVAIGYAECLRHLDRPFKDREELVNRIRRATHRLVRRQTTWFRRLTDLVRVPPDIAPERAVDLLRNTEPPPSA